VTVYLLRRVAFAFSVILAITLITFALGQVLPGDPARSAAGLNARPEQIEAARIRLGLDRPLPEQYLAYLGRLATGNLGMSIFTNRPITSDLADTLPASIELVMVAMLFNILIGVPLGVVAAVRGGAVDATTRMGVLIGAAIPVFWLALVFQLVFAVELGWFPLVGRIDTGMNPGPRTTGLLLVDTLINARFDVWLSSLRHLMLPALTLAVLFIAVTARTTRAAMARVLDEDYLQFARAKGVPEQRVIVRHALRNALVPIVTIIGLQFGWMLASTVLVESVFGYPGIGSYAVTAVLQTDIFAVIAVVLIIAIVFVVANLVVDALLVAINPRIRLAGRRT
jgi:peptide/nickel transport system permease protein